MRDAFIKELSTAASGNEQIVLLTGDLGFGVFDEFSNLFPEQFINCGVAEQSMMGIASGMASLGANAFVYSINNFVTMRCLEQIRNDICYMNQPVCIVSVGAGYAYGSLGYTHHGLEDLAIMRSLPNMEIYSPCDSFETTLAVREILTNKGPSYLRLGRNGEQNFHQNEPTSLDPIAFGNNEKGCILFTGAIGKYAFEVQQTLENLGISISVVSVPAFSRLTAENIKQYVKSGPVVTLEEHSKIGGFGSYVLEILNQSGLSTKINILGSERVDLSGVGKPEYLVAENIPDIHNLARFFKV